MHETGNSCSINVYFYVDTETQKRSFTIHESLNGDNEIALISLTSFPVIIEIFPIWATFSMKIVAVKVIHICQQTL